MNYSLEINQQNVQPHLDIEKDIAEKGNGLFTFILRVNNGVIVDYSVIENVNIARDYIAVTHVASKEFTIALDN